MAGWNFAELWEAIADKFPDAQAQVQGEKRFTWREFDSRSDALAHHLIEGGAVHQDKVALYLYNCPEYMESMFAAFKAGLVPVNTNYRYADDELTYLWDNADAVAVVFHGTFTETIERIRGRVPVRIWLWVDDGTGPCPEWAVPYEEAAATETERVFAPWGRGDDDITMMYTGGTTGMPKGVMWRQDSLIRAVCGAANPLYREEVDYDAVRAGMAAGAGGRLMPGCPLMHGTAQYTSMMSLVGGGAVVTLEGRTFDVTELLYVIEREKINVAVIVGDAFAKPMLRALDAEPDRWDLSSLFMLTSSGVMWSQETKDALLAHHPGMLLYDAFSSSEAIGLGQSISSAGGTSAAGSVLVPTRGGAAGAGWAMNSVCVPGRGGEGAGTGPGGATNGSVCAPLCAGTSVMPAAPFST